MALEGVAGTGRPAEETNSTQQSNNLGGFQQDQFMKILLEQLKQQNPLNPQKGGEFVSQMARLTSTQQISQMANTLESMKQSSQAQQFLSVLGEKVNLTRNDGETMSGEISSVKFQGERTVVKIGEKEVDSTRIASIGVPSENNNSS